MKLIRPIGALLIVVLAGFLLRNQFPNIGNSIKQFSSSFSISNIENDSSKLADKVAENVEDNLPPPLRGGSTSGSGGAGTAALSASGVISTTNKERADNGALPALRENSKLDASAAAKVKDMFAKQYFEHTSPDGKGPADLAKAAGYSYILIGENLALGDFKNNQDLLTAWMNSPGHRANILNSRFTEMGAAVTQGIYQGEKVWLAVQEFGLPLSSCPSIDASLKTKIDSEKADLDSKEAALEAKKKDIDNTNPKSGDAYNAKVSEYNAMGAAYNNEVAEIKSDIAVYNKEVEAFNNCANG